MKRAALVVMVAAIALAAGRAAAIDGSVPVRAPAKSTDRLAQTSQRPSATPPAAAPTPAAAGQAAAPAAPQPVRTEILNNDNWTVTCREFADKRRTCSAVLQVVQSQNNQVLFVWIVGKSNDNKLMSVLQTPTGVSLAPGVEVKLGRGPVRKAVFVNCEASRCEATMDLDDAFIRDAAATEVVEATVASTSGQSVKFTLPFKGFDKSLAALR